MSGLPGGASAPTGGTWATPTLIAGLAMERMRLDPADVDSRFIADCAEAAIRLVDNYLDREDDPIVVVVTPLILATAQVCERIYRAKDAPFGILQSWSDSDFGPVRIPTDWVRGVEEVLMPYAHRLGVG